MSSMPKFTKAALVVGIPFVFASCGVCLNLPSFSFRQAFKPLVEAPSLWANEKISVLKFNVHGKVGEISARVFPGLDSALSEVSKDMISGQGYADYWLNAINTAQDRKSIAELAKQIQCITINQDDRARIAISSVQNMPYNYEKRDECNRELDLPSQILCRNTGICSEKSLLLASLLRELGFGVALFNFNQENHMAVGIKCPPEFSYLNSGYAFIEAANPAIPTDANRYYDGVGYLDSWPQMIPICDGASFNTIGTEYKDAMRWNQLYGRHGKREFTEADFNDYKRLIEEYGLIRK